MCPRMGTALITFANIPATTATTAVAAATITPTKAAVTLGRSTVRITTAASAQTATSVHGP